MKGNCRCQRLVILLAGELCHRGGRKNGEATNQRENLQLYEFAKVHRRLAMSATLSAGVGEVMAAQLTVDLHIVAHLIQLLFLFGERFSALESRQQSL